MKIQEIKKNKNLENYLSKQVNFSNHGILTWGEYWDRFPPISKRTCFVDKRKKPGFLVCSSENSHYEVPKTFWDSLEVAVTGLVEEDVLFVKSTGMNRYHVRKYPSWVDMEGFYRVTSEQIKNGLNHVGVFFSQTDSNVTKYINVKKLYT